MTSVVLPKQFLTLRVGKPVEVKLKWGQSLVGNLASFDEYMNVKLQDTNEYINDQKEAFLGEVLIRCNNVLYVRSLDDAEIGDRIE